LVLGGRENRRLHDFCKFGDRWFHKVLWSA
jgi:hypothetical protein